ncbi:MAG: amino acid transporter, partial [Phycisphaerae bacterium]|nr:amino acid transporter [Phycisphaerae bacterium]MDW8261818.1 hypothetical protein [Phycisphaerales bacterium]
LGMVLHWWKRRATERNWRTKLAVNGIGLVVTGFTLVTLCIFKFHDGGWITLIVTSAVVTMAVAIRRHYQRAANELHRLDSIVRATDRYSRSISVQPPANEGRTAIVLVNGYNGLGLHTFYGIFRFFPRTFSRFVFVQIGAVDAGSFKGAEELERLREDTRRQAQAYVELCHRHGLQAEARTAIGTDPIAEISAITDRLLREHPGAVVFGGQLAFVTETVWTRLLHNYVVFTMQSILCRRGVPFVIVPARV